MLGYCFEAFNQRGEVSIWRSVFISDYNDCFPLRAFKTLQLPTIRNGAYVAGIGMEKID